MDERAIFPKKRSRSPIKPDENHVYLWCNKENDLPNELVGFNVREGREIPRIPEISRNCTSDDQVPLKRSVAATARSWKRETYPSSRQAYVNFRVLSNYIERAKSTVISNNCLNFNILSFVLASTRNRLWINMYTYQYTYILCTLIISIYTYTLYIYI